MKIKIDRIGILAVIITSIIPLRADDWIQWRGPEGRGISQETEWNPEALKGAPVVQWTKNIGRGHGHVTVRGDFLYVLGDQQTTVGVDTLVENIVHCINSKSGDDVWRYSYPGKNRAYGGPRTTPVLDGNRLYALGPDGNLHCVNTGNGHIIWKKNLKEDFKVRIPYWGFSGSPVIEDDLIILTAGRSGLALNKLTGAKVWGDSLGHECSLSSPVLCDLDNNRVALITGGGKLHAVQVKDGQVLWSMDWNCEMDPVVLGDQVFMARNPDGCKLITILNGRPDVVWQDKKIKGTFQGFTVWRDHAYGFGSLRRNQPLCCINIHDGNLNWKQDLGQWGDMMIADGKLIVITGAGELIIADAAPDRLNIISRARVIDVPVDESKPMQQRCFMWTMPVLANGMIYVRNTAGDLVCVGMRKEAS